jgi:hypothetical protein
MAAAGYTGGFDCSLICRSFSDTGMLPRFAIVMLVALPGCAHTVAQTGLRAPNPNGCYAIVYEGPSYRGADDVFNGPARLPTLDQITLISGANWHRRIRSLRVGPAATVTAYIETAFMGRSRQFGPATEHARLDDAFSARIQSLEVTCVDRTRVAL